MVDKYLLYVLFANCNIEQMNRNLKYETKTATY
jgi:hypothetical protein